MAVIGDFSLSLSASTPKAPSLPSLPPGGPPLTPPGSFGSAPATAVSTINRSLAVATLTPGLAKPITKTLAVALQAPDLAGARKSYGLSDGVGADPAEFYGPSPVPVGLTWAQAEAAASKPPWPLIAAGVAAIAVVGVVVATRKKRR